MVVASGEHDARVIKANDYLNDNLFLPLCFGGGEFWNCYSIYILNSSEIANDYRDAKYLFP